MFKRKGHIPPAATYREVWSKGDAADKLSFFVMGASALKHKQWDQSAGNGNRLLCMAVHQRSACPGPIAKLRRC